MTEGARLFIMREFYNHHEEDILRLEEDDDHNHHQEHKLRLKEEASGVN